MMKTLIILLSLTGLLAGCASQPEYRHAKNGGQGYSEQKVTDDRYRIQFKSRKSDVAKTTNYALLRAAELTQQQGYDWFVIISRETFVESEKVNSGSSIGASHQREMVRDCTLLTCQTRSRPSSEVSMGINLGRDTKNQVHAILEIRLGKGTRPETESYNAQEVLQNLQQS
ncbi:MAG: hypothetical protein ACI8R9_001501 [Paraglaciecola sp.]|jgi:hypothetical protein